MDAALSDSQEACRAKMAALLTLLETRHIALCCLQKFGVREHRGDHAEAFAIAAFAEAASRGGRWRLECVCVDDGDSGEVHGFVWDSTVLDCLDAPRRLVGGQATAGPSLAVARFRASGASIAGLEFLAASVWVGDDQNPEITRAAVDSLWPVMRGQLSPDDLGRMILLGSFNMGLPPPAAAAGVAQDAGIWGALETEFVRCASADPTNVDLDGTGDRLYCDHVLLALPLVQRCGLSRGDAQATVVKIDDEAIAAHGGVDAFKEALAQTSQGETYGEMFSRLGGSAHRPVLITLPKKPGKPEKPEKPRLEADDNAADADPPGALRDDLPSGIRDDDSSEKAGRCLGITKKGKRCQSKVDPTADNGGGYCPNHQAQRPGAPLHDAPGDASSSGIRTVATWNLNLDRRLSLSRDSCAAKMASLMTLLESRNISLCCLQEFALRGPCTIPNCPPEYAAGEAFAVSAFYAAAARAHNGRRWQLETVCVGPGGVGEVHAFVWDDDLIEALGTPWRLFAAEPVPEPPAETEATGATTGVPGTPQPNLKRSPSAGRFRARGPGVSDSISDSITDSSPGKVPLSFTAVCVHICSSSAENGGLAGVRAEVAFLWPAVRDELSSVRDSEPESVILLGDFNLGPPAVGGLTRQPAALGAWGALEPHFVRFESPEPTNLERLAARRDDRFFYDHVLLASPLARRCRMARRETQATVVKIDDEAIAAHFQIERGRGSQREYESAIEAKVPEYKAHLMADLMGDKARKDHGKYFSKQGGSCHRPVTIRLPAWIAREEARDRVDDAALVRDLGVLYEQIARMGLGR